MVKTACLESRRSRGPNPALAFEFQRNKICLFRSFVKIQYCTEPPWPRDSLVSLRPPWLEFCVWRAVSNHSSHHPQEVLLAQFSLHVHKGGLKPHSFRFFVLKTPIHHSQNAHVFAVENVVGGGFGKRVRFK